MRSETEGDGSKTGIGGIPRAADGDSVSIVLEHLRLAQSELVKRIEMQMKLVELYGFFVLSAYSAGVISGHYELLLFVPIASGLIAIWWIDRQGMIILLRCFIVEQIEGQMLPKVLRDSDGLVSSGWQSYFYRHYYSRTRRAHRIIFLAVLLMTLVPSSIFALGCIHLAWVAFLADSRIYESMKWYYGHRYGRWIAGGTVLLATWFFWQAFRLNRGLKKFDSHMVLSRLAEPSWQRLGGRSSNYFLDLEVN